MKNYKLKLFLALLFCVAAGATLTAQYDDLYYDPDTDATELYGEPVADNSSDLYASDDEGYYYDDEEYDYVEDASNYYYSSRIRRFNRPYYGFDYFDPVYADSYYYDPYLPGANTVLIYDDVYNYNSWARYNRYNRYNWYSYNRGYYDPFFNSYRYSVYGSGFNSFYGSPVTSAYGVGYGGYGGYGLGSFSSAYYCPPSYGGAIYNTSSNYNVQGSGANTNFYGPRTTGIVTVPRGSGSITGQNLSDSRVARTTRTRGTTTRNGGLGLTPNSDNGVNTGNRSNSRSSYATPRANSQSRIYTNSRSNSRSSYGTTPRSSQSYSAPRTSSPSRSFGESSFGRSSTFDTSRSSGSSIRSSGGSSGGSSIRSSGGSSGASRSRGGGQ